MGNVRAVITEEDAIDQTLAATMEIQNSQNEGSDFEYINYSRSAVSLNYPSVDNTGSFVSELGAQSTVQGPANLSAVGMSDQIQLSVQSWYDNATSTTTLQTVESIFADMVSNIILQGTNVVADENSLLQLQNSTSNQSGYLLGFLNNNLGNEDLTIPQGYLVYIFMDENLNVNAAYSGVLQVAVPGELEFLQTQLLTMPSDGYFYVPLSVPTSQIIATKK